jgi:hypothetical protein
MTDMCKVSSFLDEDFQPSPAPPATVRPQLQVQSAKESMSILSKLLGPWTLGVVVRGSLTTVYKGFAIHLI